MFRWSVRLLLGSAAALFCHTAHGVTLDWDAVSWTAGTLSNSYNVDPANGGNDISVSAAASGGAVFLSDPVTGLASPTRNSTLGGGLSPVQNSLKITADLSAGYITVTIDFSAFYPLGVQDLSFTLFDVDLNGASYRAQDEISSIVATNGATSIAPTITNVGSSVTHSGTGLSQQLIGNADAVDSGAGSGVGNATISFGSNAVKTVTFRWDRGPDATGSAPTAYISIHDINFTPVPEVNPAVAAFALCGVAAFGALWVKRRRRGAPELNIKLP